NLIVSNGHSEQFFGFLPIVLGRFEIAESFVDLGSQKIRFLILGVLLDDHFEVRQSVLDRPRAEASMRPVLQIEKFLAPLECDLIIVDRPAVVPVPKAEVPSSIESSRMFVPAFDGG